MKPEENKGLENHTIILMIGAAVFFDILQTLLTFIFMGWLVGIFAGLTFYVWFKVHGISFMKPKRFFTFGGGLIIEIIPFLSALPAWTAAVTILALDTKIKEIVAKIPGGKMAADVLSQRHGNSLGVNNRNDALSELNSKENRTREENIRLVKARQIMERGTIDVNETDPALRAAYEKVKRGGKAEDFNFSNVRRM